MQLDDWIKVKIEVHGRQAKLYLNGSDNPSLSIDGLKGEDLSGTIALWSYAGEEAYFSNLKITPTKPEPIQNGGEATGTWDVKFFSDAGTHTGTLKLTRQNSTLTGTWSGSFGPDQPVTGTYRNGYVEITFKGTWPKTSEPITATLAGWIDEDTAKGRMKVEGKADGRWTATRTK